MHSVTLLWNIWNYSAVPDISIVFIFQKLGSLRILEKFLFSNFLVSVLLCYKSFLDYLLGAFALLYLHTSSIYLPYCFQHSGLAILNQKKKYIFEFFFRKCNIKTYYYLCNNRGQGGSIQSLRKKVCTSRHLTGLWLQNRQFDNI